MKRTLGITAIVLGLLVAGGAVFLATFDADRYRPLVLTQLQAALHKPVTLERLSLGWRGGLAVELHKLAVYPGEPGSGASGEPAVSVERASAVVHLLPLIRREISIASVVIDKPVVRVRRDASGVIEVVGLMVIGAPAAASGRSPAGLRHSLGSGESAASVGRSTFTISMVRISDGVIGWTDELMHSPSGTLAQPPLALQATAVDLTLHDLSPSSVDVELRAAVFSSAQNLQFKGRLWLPDPKTQTPPKLEDARLTTDLRQLDVQALARAFPAIAPLGLQSGLAGRLNVSVDQLVLDPNALASLAARVRLSDGRVPLAALGKPIDNVTVDLTAKPDRIELKQGSAMVGGGMVTASGAIDQPARAAAVTLDVTLKDLLLENLAPAGAPQDPRLFGRLSASFHGTGQGLAWPQLSRTLNGQGRVMINQMKLANMNILHEVFSRLSVLPGLAQKLQEKLPASYQPKLTAQETAFQPVDVAITAQQGQVSWSDLKLITDSFELEGVGHVGADGSLSSTATLRIDPDLSAALMSSVKELQQLVDNQGRMQLPVVMQGVLPRVSVLPDVQYVASRIVATKAEEFLGNLLERALRKQEGAEQPQPASP